MFYLILAILLVLFYIFVAPKNVKGTINLILAVFFLVVLVIALILGILKIMQFSTKFWIGLIMILIGLWAMRDIHNLESSPKGK
ncbi:TPA: DUF3165 family protein [Streptococcus suis]|nr:DUF3165 family protein [Streptococcus suis]